MGAFIPYPLAADAFGPEEIAAATAVLQSGRVTMGPEVAAFEAEFSEWVGAKHALMVNSGSSANLLAVDAMLRRADGEGRWRPGDEVLVPALAWPTTVWPLAQLGLVPVLVDVDADTLAIDLDSARQALSPRTKGMFLIHVLGRAADLDEYATFCRNAGLSLLEDACETLGAHHRGIHAGLFGEAATFSCYFSHHISTIEGGMIVTNDRALRDDLASLRAHGWVRERSDKLDWAARYPEIDPRFLFVMPGYNVRATEIQAAIGRVQLKKLDSMLEARERLAMRVRGWLENSSPWLELIGASCLPLKDEHPTRKSRTHSWMTLPIRTRSGAAANAATVQRHLETMGVETRPIIAGNIGKHPAARRVPMRQAPSLSQCDRLLSDGFMIGCHPQPQPGSLETLERAIASLATLAA